MQIRNISLQHQASIDEKNKKNLESGVSIGENEPITKPAKIENLKNGTYEELKDKLNLKNIIMLILNIIYSQLFVDTLQFQKDAGIR